jgi:CRISPR/Cas system-associated exonuclease Cas4 (RecB family)
MIISKERPDVVETLLADINKRYGLDHGREGIHATDLMYCLRKAHWAKTNPLPPTPTETLYYIRGLGLQDMILNKETVPVEKDGIVASPDYLVDGKIPLELKTTLIGKKRLDNYDFPGGWIKQMKTYSYILGVKQAVLLIFTMSTPTELLSYILTFTDEELLANWNELLGKKAELELALESNIPPRPFNEDWECRDCKYRLRCMEIK